MEIFSGLLSFVRGVPSQTDIHADLWCFFTVSLNTLLRQTLGWPVIWDAMTVIWPRRNENIISQTALHPAQPWLRDERNWCRNIEKCQHFGDRLFFLSNEFSTFKIASCFRYEIVRIWEGDPSKISY